MPSDPVVRFGILGAARIARKLAPAIQQAEGARLVAVASRDQARAKAFADEFGIPLSFGSYEALLDSNTVDAIYLPLPPALHLPWTKAAAERGKHVLCEKPLAATADEAREMAAVCKAAGVQLLDGTMWVHHPRAAAMRMFLQDGSLGELRRVTSVFTFLDDVLPPGDFRYAREYGGGSLLDLGWYCVRASMWAFGGFPERVAGWARWENDVDIDFLGHLWFAGYRTASLESGFRTVRRKWLEVAGTHGSLVCDDFTRAKDPEQPRFWVHDADGNSTTHVVPGPQQEVCMVENFCRTVLSGQLREDWSVDAVATQVVCEALDRAARTGQTIEIDWNRG